MPYLVKPVVTGAELMTLQPTIEAEGGDLVLRPWRRADARQLVDAMADDAIQRWNLESLTSLAEASHWVERWHHRWRKRTGASWAVSDVDDPDTVLGQVAFRSLWLADGLAELSCWVAPGVRRRHVGTDATRALTGWAFDRLGMQRLEIVHSVNNRASCPVALRAGFAREGVRRSLQRHADGFHDMCQHARIRTDSGAPVTGPVGAPMSTGAPSAPDDLALRRRVRRARTGTAKIFPELSAVSVGGGMGRGSQG